MRTEDEIRADAADEAPFPNASQRDIWADRFCHNECAHDDDATETWCPIIMVAMMGKAGDGRSTAWPKEWTRRVHPGWGEVVDVCTEYQPRPEVLDLQPVMPPPELPGQMTIIDVHLPGDGPTR